MIGLEVGELNAVAARKLLAGGGAVSGTRRSSASLSALRDARDRGWKAARLADPGHVLPVTGRRASRLARPSCRACQLGRSSIARRAPRGQRQEPCRLQLLQFGLNHALDLAVHELTIPNTGACDLKAALYLHVFARHRRKLLQ